MSFRPCFLVPVYNHPHTIGKVVKRLAAFDLPIYLIDDGSDAPTRKALAQTVAACPLARLITLPVNGGKGAAVIAGFEQAHADGLTHALQVDADGQHDLADVPRFLALGAATPEAVVCGRPIYDGSVPKARLYGRAITHFWVGVETLSRDVPDSMCGFRLYPLAATMRVLGPHIARRMAFDIEILVRLAWLGGPIINVPTRVTYPEDGISHFAMLADNLRISATHTRLVAGMLWRAPALLWRRLRRGDGTRHWSRLAERGSSLGLSTVLATYRLLGRRMATLLLYPIVGYFLLTGRNARQASQTYLDRVYRHFGPSAALPQPPGWRDSYRHMLAFARAGLDKLAAWSGGVDAREVAFHGRADFDGLIASGRGALIIGSHLGNLEMARALGVAARFTTINAVVYTEHAVRFNAMMAEANPDFAFNLIQVTDFGPDTAIAFKDKIDRGELLFIVGDRTPVAENGRTRRLPFLGRPAPFAQGPFVLAHLLECPVFLFFCLEHGGGHQLYFEPFAERIALPRRQRDAALQQHMGAYARRLEHYCGQAPLQWFNFFDFWEDGAAPQPSKP